MGSDVVYANGLPFLATFSRRLMNRTAEYILGRSKNSLMKVLDSGFAIYTNQVYADHEFRPVLDLVETSLGAKLNFCNTAEQVPEAEHNDKVSRTYST